MLRRLYVLPRSSGKAGACLLASRGVANESGPLSGHHLNRSRPPTPDGLKAQQQRDVATPAFSNPMEALTFVFKANPSALRLHRELTLALARGDAESAADLAGLLAQKVKVALSAGEESGTARSPAPADVGEKEAAQAELPKPTADDVESAMDVVVAEMLQRAKHAKVPHDGKVSVMDVVPEAAKPPVAKQAPKPQTEEKETEVFWRSSDALRVTIIESSFETTAPEASSDPRIGIDTAGAVADDLLGGIGESEERDLQILDAYLAKEAARWKAQKEAIAKVLVDTAKRIGLTPELVHTFDESTREIGSHKKPWNALKHYNIIVRGVVPTLGSFPLSSSHGNGESSLSVATEIRKELDELEKRMKERGVTLRAEEKEMALYELAMSKCSMHYVVGIHRELQLAMDAAVTSQQGTAAATNKSAGGKKGSQQFMDLAMSALHPDDPAVAERSGLGAVKPAMHEAMNYAVTTPVIPFTFTIKLCMWYDVPSNVETPDPSVDS